MDCICLNRRRRKKNRQSKINKESGLKNAAYVKDDDDDDILKNNAVLTELEQSGASTTENHLNTHKTDGKNDTNGNSHTVQTSSDISIHPTSSDRSVDAQGSLTTVNILPPGTQDDHCLNDYNYDCFDVDLMSKDPVGPGFSVTGTVTDGIIVGSLHEKGPAVQSGQIAIGDKILSVTIGFNNMAYEDALTILSYAAPYPMTLKLARSSNSQSSTTTGPPGELNELNSRIYHPVYRSQSLGGGLNHSKKKRKMPSRPGTSLSQVDYKTQEMCNEGSEDSLEGTLVKDKFGNTLNLINGSESQLHRLSDSDTTVDSSSRSDSRLQGSATRYAETSEEVATTFCIPVQAVAGSSFEMTPVIAEAMVTEPPTQTKLAILASPSPIPDETNNSQPSSRVTTPTSPNQIPPEKPKRAHQLLAAGDVSPQSIELASLPTQELEEEIIPSSKPRVMHSPFSSLGEDTTNTNSVAVEKTTTDSSAQPEVEDVEIIDHIGDISEPVEEPVIAPTHKLKQESLSTELWVNNAEKLMLDSNAVTKPATLTVDTVKIKDSEALGLDTNSSRDSVNAFEQPSPNDSGIHSEKAPSEQEEPMSPTDDVSSGTGSPSTSHRHNVSNSTDDIMSAVLGLSASKEKQDEQEGKEAPSTPSSQISTPRKLSLTGLFASSYVQQPPNIKRRRARPRSAGSITNITSNATKFIQPPEPQIPKATSRSQLEAARARFFAELMQTSDLFKDTPTESLTFSSDSLNVESAPPPATSTDAFSKHMTATKTTTNNNSLTSAAGLSSTWRPTDRANSTVGDQENAA